MTQGEKVPPEGRSGDGVAEQVSALLAPIIGPFNARVWLKTVAQRELARAPSELAVSDLPKLLDGLRHSLNTLMGREAAGELVERIRNEVR